MSEGLPATDSLEVILTRLHEAHCLSAYEAVDRLVRAGATAGFDVNTLVGMLDQGIAFQKLLELIVSKSVPLSSASPESGRKPRPDSPAQPEKVMRRVVVT